MIYNWKFSDNYIICKRESSESLICIEENFDDIEFTECSSNTKYRKYSVFHTCECKQYPRDSIEDREQIQYLANLILQFCEERMNIETVPLKRPLPSPFDNEEYYWRDLRNKGII